jgi:hypothetical protein
VKCTPSQLTYADGSAHVFVPGSPQNDDVLKL